MNCGWCVTIDRIDPDGFCITHRAEWLGTTVADLQRGQSEQSDEWRDTL